MSDEYVLTIDQMPRLSHPLDKDYAQPQTWMDNLSGDAQRYQWLKEHMTVVLCEGKTTECYSKYMLPRLMAESRSGEKYTLDEIIDMKMGGEGI